MTFRQELRIRFFIAPARSTYVSFRFASKSPNSATRSIPDQDMNCNLLHLVGYINASEVLADVSIFGALHLLLLSRFQGFSPVFHGFDKDPQTLKA